MSLQPLPVLISGAGLGGLLLAQSLKRYRIPFELYERDPAGRSRSQGYRIRLSSQGLHAIEAVLSPERYAQFKKGCADTGSGKITAYDAKTMEQKPFSGGGPPKGGGQVLGVDRAFLRNTLFEDIEDDVKFGKNVVGYQVEADGVCALFNDGSRSTKGSILVGADGVRSRITKQLTNDRLKVYDTGARMIHGSTPKAAFQGLAKGSFGAFSIQDMSNPAGKVAIITNVRDSDEEHFGWVMVGSPGTFSAPDDDFSVTGQAAVDISVDLTKAWHESIRPILTDQLVDEAAFLKMSTSEPKGVHVWQNEPRVTLLGDAVHAMTPAGGVGANTALRDAELLGRRLKERGGWAEDVTRIYEEEMRVYASENVADSFGTASKMFDINELNTTI